MREERVEFEMAGQTYELFVARPDVGGVRPAVLVFHAWTGQGEHERDKACRVASELGMIGIACDLWGKGVFVTDPIECGKKMTPFMRDRHKLRSVLAETLRVATTQVEGVDSKRVSAMGYCFGGLCVLDMVRMGQDLKAAVSFHGLFRVEDENRARPGGPKTEVLMLHGFDDPMVPHQDILAVSREFTDAGVPFAMHVFGHTKHGFTNTTATDATRGVYYSESADRRSWQMAKALLAEVQ